MRKSVVVCDFSTNPASHSMEAESPRALRALEDEDLVDLAVTHRGSPRGDAAACELFGRYHARIHAWCRRWIRDPDRALDLAQDAQLKAWRRLDRFERRAQFGSWLFVVVRNTCFSALRPVSWIQDDDEDALEAVVDPRPMADAAIEQTQDVERLRRILDEALAPDERRALSLRCFERVPVEEITTIMELDNLTGARALLQKARRKLRAALAREDAAPRQGDPR